MKSMCIYFSDLKKDVRKEFVRRFGADGNWDITPLFVMEVEEDAECMEGEEGEVGSSRSNGSLRG